MAARGGASPRPSGRGRLRAPALGLVAALALLPACGGGLRGDPVPPAQAYDRAVTFEGIWEGEVGEVFGTLEVTPLEPLRLRGLFRAQDESLTLVLAVERVTVAGPGGAPRPANLAHVTWQDGRGGRGRGWLLINRAGTTLTGTLGSGERTRGAGIWTFVRRP